MSQAETADRQEVVDLLERAAARLQSTGWTRNDYGTARGPNCVAGAIQAELPEMARESVWTAAEGAVLSLLDFTIEHWNDTVCQDGGEAADLLLTAAKKVAGQS